MFDPAKPIVLVSDQSWEDDGGGAVILKSLVAPYLGKGLIWASPSSKQIDLANGKYGLGSGSLGKTGEFSSFHDWLRSGAKLSDEVLSLARNTSAAGIWTVMHGATVGIASQLAKKNLVSHATIHDDPVFATAFRSKKMFFFTPIVARQFERVIRTVKSIDVIGEGMQQYYERKFGVKSSILHRSLSNPVQTTPVYDFDTNGLTVAVCGNVYNYSQLPLLANAVWMAAQKLAIKGKIVVYGNGYGDRLKKEFIGKLEIESTGHLSEEDLIKRLQSCGILYLNYPFSMIARTLRETSFPTKLSTFIYAARPMLVHSPINSTISGLSPVSLFGHWRCMNADVGCSTICSMVTSSTFTESKFELCEVVRKTYFNSETHGSTMFELFAKR